MAKRELKKEDTVNSMVSSDPGEDEDGNPIQKKPTFVRVSKKKARLVGTAKRKHYGRAFWKKLNKIDTAISVLSDGLSSFGFERMMNMITASFWESFTTRPAE